MAPPTLATLLKVTVPRTRLVPTTVGALNEIDDRADAPVTVSREDAELLPIDAVMVVEPADAVVMENVALDFPAEMSSGVTIVATAALLLESERLAPAASAAPDRLTVARTVVPADTVDRFNAIPDTVGEVVGLVGVRELLQPAVANAAVARRTSAKIDAS